MTPRPEAPPTLLAAVAVLVLGVEVRGAAAGAALVHRALAELQEKAELPAALGARASVRLEVKERSRAT
jgi:hypothetical protein